MHPAKHRSKNNCPVFPAIITTERDGYFGDATVISRPMLKMHLQPGGTAVPLHET
jgi:hypothetical protein